MKERGKFQTKEKQKSFRLVLIRVLVVVGLVSLGLLLRELIFKELGTNTYEDAAAIAFHQEGSDASREKTPRETEPVPPKTWVPAPVEEEDPNLELLEGIDLAALREVNPDVVGWILVPQTKINYPIMQGEDNDYYLKHTWDEKSNNVGSIFLECRNSSDLTDFNTIIYGHNMNDDSMFGTLSRYASQWQWDNSPYVYLATDQGVYRYDIFSCYRAPVESFTYGLSFNQEMTKVNFLVQAKETSQIENDVWPELHDRILTLSTCSGSGYSNRWVVQARLKMVLSE